MKRIQKLTIRLIMLMMAVFLICAVPATTQAAEITFIEIIIDCSETMKRNVDGETKLETVKTAMVDFVNNAPSSHRFALRIMGGDEDSTYYTSKLVAGMGLMSSFSMVEEIQKLKAAGERSLYHALNECLYDFPEGLGGNVAILITDGLDDGGQSLSGLEFLYANSPDAPRLFVFGLDITKAMSKEFGLLTKAAGGRVENLDDPSELSERLGKALEELGANLNVYLFDKNGSPAVGNIVIQDAAGLPVRAVYGQSSFSAEIEPGQYTVEAKYEGEVQRTDTLDISAGNPETVNIVFQTKSGNLRITLLDDFYQPLKGYVKIRNSLSEIVYESGPADEFHISLPEGRYEIEGIAGDRSWTEYGVQITADTIRDIEISVPVLQSVLEVEVSNLESLAVNAAIRVYTLDGFLIGEAGYTSYFYLTLPPDDYIVAIEVGDVRQEKSVKLLEGDQFTLDFDVDITMGFLLVELRTVSGYEAWGVVRIYDSSGQYSRHWSVESDESPDWSFELPEGIYRVEAEAEGVIRSRGNIRVVADEETWIEITFPDYVR